MSGEQVTRPMQVQWRGVLIGDTDRRVLLSEVRGWLDSPDMRTSDSDRPGRHGQFPGSMFAGGRTIEVDFTILDESMLAAMQAAPIPDENPVEESLTVWVGTAQAQTVQARCARWSLPTDAQFAAGYRRGTYQFKATDPRKYGTSLRTASTGLPAPVDSGLAFPLAFPLDFGAGVQGGDMTVYNGGDAAMWPVWIIDGPVTGPIITCLDTGKQLAFDSSFTVLAGQQLVIDTDSRSVLLAGTTSRRDQVTTAQWFPLPGNARTRVGFSAAAYDAGARLSVQWRDSWL